MSRSTQLLWLSLCSGAALACGTTSTTTAEPDAVTLISVDPEDFPASAQCGADQGNTSYVAELFDVSGLVSKDALDRVALPSLRTTARQERLTFSLQSSPLTACNQAVAFGQVVENHQYVARVRTYAALGDDVDAPKLCVIEGTSFVTLPKDDGSCAATLAEATTLAPHLAEFTCFGWRASDPPASSTSEAPTTDANCEEEETRGCAAMAMSHRTVTLGYCVGG